LGVDGGGAKTVALLGDADAVILGSGRAGNSCIYRAGSPSGAIDEICSAVLQACDSAHVARDAIGVAAFTLAGADWPEDYDYLEVGLRRLLPRSELLILNDVFGALRTGADTGVGACVVGGTGANIGAQGPDGARWYASFWLPVPSGARGMAWSGVFAAVRDELGLGPRTSLTERVREFFGVASVESVLHAFTRRDPRPDMELAPFAVIVMDEAAAGDPAATQVVTDLGRRFGEYVRVAAGRVGLAEGYPLVLAGGLFRHQSHLLLDAVASMAPGSLPRRASHEPAVGALLLALDRTAPPRPAATVRGLPPVEFFVA
jgi:N-acetylglucosamine kinase-like BadF-type ATPase